MELKTEKGSFVGHSSSSFFLKRPLLPDNLILSLPIWTPNQSGPVYAARVEKPMISRDEIVLIFLSQFFEFDGGYLRFWWGKSWPLELFRKEIRSNGELTIILLILASYLTQRLMNYEIWNKNIIMRLFSIKIVSARGLLVTLNRRHFSCFSLEQPTRCARWA